MDELAKSQIFTVRLGSLAAQPASGNDLRETRLAVGTVIDQKYKILAMLGEGGMGAVYKARHELLHKEVALKTFNGQVQGEEVQQRFQREAQSLAKLRHRNVVEVFDYGFQKDQTPFYTMEYLVGKSLAEKIDGGKILGAEQVLPLFIQASAGLAYVHSKGLVHRDLKPGNIFIEKSGNVKIVDFGIVLTTGEQGEDQRLTRTTDGIIMGSPLYMSPEQAMGLAVGPASDVYSFGCALFECLTGTAPFVGSNALATILMHQSQKAPSLREACGGDFSPQLELVVARLLAKKPEARYRDFEAVESSLKRCLESVSGLNFDKDFYEHGTDAENEQDDNTNKDQYFPVHSKYLIAAGLFTLIVAVVVCAFFWKPQPRAVPLKLSTIENKELYSTSDHIITYTKGSNKPLEVTPALAKFPVENVKGPHGENYLHVIFPTNIDIGTYRYQVLDSKVIQAQGSKFWPVSAEIIFEPEPDFAQNPVNFDLLSPLSLRGLDLRKCDPLRINKEILTRVAKMQLLHYFFAPKGSLVSDDLKYLSQLHDLKTLDIENTGITGSALAKWPKLGQLSSLNVSGIADAQKVIDSLKKSDKIYALYIDRTPLTHDDYKDLAEINSLHHLIVMNSHLDDQNLQILADKPAALLSLSAKYCSVTPAMLPVLQKMKERGLKHLEMNSTKFSELDCARMKWALKGLNCDLSPTADDFKREAFGTEDEKMFGQD